MLSVLAGADPNDPATQDVPLGDLDAALGAGLEGLRVALCPSLHLVALAPDIDDVWERAVDVVRGLGAEIVERDLPAAEAHLRDVRRHPARRGPLHARAARPLSRPGRCVRRRRSRPARGGDGGNGVGLPGRGGGAPAHPSRVRASLRRRGPAADPGRRRLALPDRRGDGDAPGPGGRLPRARHVLHGSPGSDRSPRLRRARGLRRARHPGRHPVHRAALAGGQSAERRRGLLRRDARGAGAPARP